VVLCGRREHSSRGFDPEDAARRSGSGPAIRRCWRHGSLDKACPDRKVVHKSNTNRRDSETEQVLQIMMPILEATL
jgi:hypothetical protein